METDKRIAVLQKEKIDKAYKNLDGQQEANLWNKEKSKRTCRIQAEQKRSSLTNIKKTLN